MKNGEKKRSSLIVMMRRRRINEGKTVQLRVLVTIFLYFMR
jgi:hypothetical protein